MGSSNLKMSLILHFRLIITDFDFAISSSKDGPFIATNVPLTFKKGMHNSVKISNDATAQNIR